MSSMRSIGSALACALCFAPITPAQAPVEQPVPPEIVLGRRAESVRQTIKTFPTLVIVESPGAYTQMVAQWSLGARFPVLIDDGSDEAAENIARFVRGFEPDQVVRWRPPKEVAEQVVFPEDLSQRRTLIEQAALAAWGAESPQQQLDIWTKTGFTPPGVVVASALDPAWTAALALAAGRGQPIVWTDLAPAPCSGFMTAPALAALEETIAASLNVDDYKWSWRGLGDDIDALTLCMSQPSKYRKNDQILAVTDRLGRHEDASRWAWCGMIFGDEASAAYRAMSSLFIRPRSAWLFDGYRENFAPPYAIKPAAALFEKAGFRVATNFPPHASLEHWRERAEGGVAAGLVFVNTQGFARWFMLNPGRGRSGDVPFLRIPAVVVFVHSFSAQRVADSDTIAGRWLDRGAMAFYGSCDEPTLGGFVPNHIVAAKLLSGGALGGSVRQSAGRGAAIWKLNLFGDPLFTLGVATPRPAERLEIPGAVPLEDEMRAALRAGHLAEGARMLTMLGRDGDATRLSEAALEGETNRMTPAFASVTIPAALRENEPQLLVELYAQLADDPELAAKHRDALWHGARSLLARPEIDERLIDMLRLAIREESADDDAAALAPLISRLQGKPSVRAMYAELIGASTDHEVRAWLEAGLRSW